MNKMWNCVYSYCGIYSNQKIFKNKEDAEKWFDTIADGNDNWTDEELVEINKTDEYMTYYDRDERHPSKISCRLVEVE